MSSMKRLLEDYETRLQLFNWPEHREAKVENHWKRVDELHTLGAIQQAHDPRATIWNRHVPLDYRR